jgi:hypothetical protein
MLKIISDPDYNALKIARHLGNAGLKMDRVWYLSRRLEWGGKFFVTTTTIPGE